MSVTWVTIVHYAPSNEAGLADSVVTNKNNLEDVVIVDGSPTLQYHTCRGQSSMDKSHSMPNTMGYSIKKEYGNSANPL